MSRIVSVTMIIALAAACAHAPAPVAAAIPVDPACEALSDSLSKYVSSDALPAATFAGDSADLRTGAPATAVSVDFVVGPNGVADAGTIEVIGSNDAAYKQAVAAFAEKNRFVPAKVNGCSVLSRFTLVLR